MALTLFTWILGLLLGVVTSFTTLPPPDSSTDSFTDCGTITNITETLWVMDTNRMTFADVKTVFPNLSVYTDDSIAEAVAQADPDSLPDIIINLEAFSGTTGESSRLFQYVTRSKPFNDQLYSLYSYFKPHTLEEETWTELKFAAVQEFVNSIYQSPIMLQLDEYMRCRGFYLGIRRGDDLWSFIYSVWFNEFPRYPGESLSSSGFENVFIGELGRDGHLALGLHNWYRFYWQERDGQVDLLGNIELVEPNILALPFCWSGYYQPLGSMFVGTSIELEMAIYMLCFLERPGQDCAVSLGGHPVTIMTEVSDSDVIGSAYPVVTVPQPSLICGDVRSTTPAPTTTSPPDCGSLTDISEILWTADTSRLSFGDAMTLFPDLTEYTDSSIAKAITQADPNSLPDIILNYQNNQSKLFQYLNVAKLPNDTYGKFQALMGEYHPEAFRDDWSTNERHYQIVDFLDSLLDTQVMKKLTAYVLCKGYAGSEEELKRLLDTIWFLGYYRYNEGGGLDSSGFENTFLGEFDDSGDNVSGLRNWYRLYLLENTGHLDYRRYVGQIEPNVQAFSFDWDNHYQPHSSVWMGSSLEFEMAIYTLCYFEQPTYGCSVSLGGHLVSIMVDISVYYEDQILSAYPELTVLQPPTTVKELSPTTSTPLTTLTSSTTPAPPSSSSTSPVSTTVADVCGSSSEIAEILWAADTNRLTFADVKTVFPNLTELTDDTIAEAVAKADPSSLPDIIINLNGFSESPRSSTKLFQYVRSSKLASYEKLEQLSQYYTPEALQNETTGASKSAAIQEFMNSVSDTIVMQELQIYLMCHGTYNPYWDDWTTLISSVWFPTYSRYPSESDSHDSSGFENTFLGEYSLDGNNVLGLHNWYRLYQLEKAGLVDLVGNIKLVEPNVLAFPFCWSGRYQPQGSTLLGSSLDFEIALYSLCFLEWPGLECKASLGGHPITIITETPDYYSIGSVYPVMTAPQALTTCAEVRPTTSEPTVPESSSTTSTRAVSTATTTITTTTTTSGDVKTPFVTHDPPFVTTRHSTPTTTGPPSTVPLSYSEETTTATGRLGCPPGLYGPTCTEGCSLFCGGDHTCDVISGACNYGCDDGHVGARCDSEGNRGNGLQVSAVTVALLSLVVLTTYFTRCRVT